jgi:hypothetical protein
MYGSMFTYIICNDIEHLLDDCHDSPPPTNLLATLNAEVIEADIEAMIRAGGLPRDRGRCLNA